jgi:hypothetical protein
MKKRLFLGLVFAAAVAGMAFTLPGFHVSAGGGAYFTSDFGGGIETSYESTEVFSIHTPYVGGGGFLFLDATYAELSLGLWGGGGPWEMKAFNVPTDMTYGLMGLDISLLGKFPFNLTSKFSLFPLLGIAYRVMLSVKNEDGDQWEGFGGDGGPADFSRFWIKLGFGVDFDLTDSLYLRGGILGGLGFPNKAEADLQDYIEKMIGTTSGISTSIGLGFGFDVKLAVGYRFF